MNRWDTKMVRWTDIGGTWTDRLAYKQTDAQMRWTTYSLAHRGAKGIHEWTARWTNRAQGGKDGVQKYTEKERGGYMDGQTDGNVGTGRAQGWTERAQGQGWTNRQKWHSAGQDRYTKEQTGQMNEQPNSLRMD